MEFLGETELLNFSALKLNNESDIYTSQTLAKGPGTRSGRTAPVVRSSWVGGYLPTHEDPSQDQRRYFPNHWNTFFHPSTAASGR